MRDVQGGAVAWRESGPRGGEPVLFLHGLGGTRSAWDSVTERLTPGWRALAWDMPGYGASRPPPGGTLSFSALADAVAAWAGEAGCAARTVHVVGHSLGGMIAQHFALRHPGRVRSLALIASSPRFGFDGVTTPDVWAAARLAPLDAGHAPADFAEAVLSGIAGPGLTSAALRAQCAAMARISPAALRAAIRCLVTHDTTNLLGRISAPTLVLVGDADTETPPSYAGFLTASIPGATLRVLPGVGHLAPAEDPGGVCLLLEEFWSSLPSP